MGVRRAGEAGVLAACLRLLAARGVFAWRSSNHGVRRVDRRTGREFYTHNGLRGVADITGVLPGGRALFVEVKGPGGKLSPDQVAFLAAADDAGALVLTVDDVRQLDAALGEALKGG